MATAVDPSQAEALESPAAIGGTKQSAFLTHWYGRMERACDDLVEQAQVVGDALGDAAMCCGAQNKMASSVMLSAQMLQQGRVIGKGRGIEAPPTGQFRLQPCFALGKPARNPQENPPVIERR